MCPPLSEGRIPTRCSAEHFLELPTSLLADYTGILNFIYNVADFVNTLRILVSE